MVSLRDRAALPGALLALALTAGALLALVLALGIRGDGPLTLLLGGADGATRLQDREAVAPLGGAGDSGVQPGPAAGPSTGAPAVLPAGSGGPAPAAGRIPARRGEVRARVPGRRSPARTPSPPVAPPAQSAPTTSTPARPVATVAPAPAVKVRGRGTPTAAPKVQKQRIGSSQPAATPAPTGAPAPAEPVVEKQLYLPEAQPPAGVGLDDGVLERVPPGTSQ